MSLSDPIADMLTRIRNAGKSGRTELTMPSSREKAAIAEVLKENGYISDCSVSGEARKELTLKLKYQNGKSVIEGLRRASKPSRRYYAGAEEMPRVQGGLGIAVVSTSRGIMTGRAARREHVGGEVLCYVW